MVFVKGDRLDAPKGKNLPALVAPGETVDIKTKVITRLARSSMLDVIRQDYITTLRANGILERQVIFRHALRNGLSPIVSITGLQAGFFAGRSPVHGGDLFLAGDRPAVVRFHLGPRRPGCLGGYAHHFLYLRLDQSSSRYHGCLPGSQAMSRLRNL